MKANEMFKELGNLWKSASPETRAKFEKMAQKEKEQYEAQKANSNEKKVNVKGGKKEKKQKPGKKDKNLDIGSTPAQKPRSAYILFSIDARAVILKEKPNLKPTEVLAALGAAWKAASLDIREKYGVLAMVEKESYGKSKNQKQSNID